MSTAVTVVNLRSLDYACMAWLEEKKGRSQSIGTERLYGRYLASFRTALRVVGLDLDSDPRAVRIVAEKWAGTGQRGEPVSGATFNNRISILNSFYDFALRLKLPWVTENPVKSTPMRAVQPYRGARALEPKVVVDRIKHIDTSTVVGLRDLAIISLALVTGRRLAEIQRLQQGDIDVQSDKVTITWNRTKGGKEMRDTLPRFVGKVLLDYVEAANVTEHVWISLSCNGTYGHQLSYKALADICEKRIGTSKFHALRHTFAHTMEQAGAKVSDIQSRLGHSNIATTGRYLQSLRSDENPHADELARLFGLN